MRVISDMRVAEDIITPEGSEVITNEIDFQLGPQIGILIHGVIGVPSNIVNTSLAALDDEMNNRQAHQSLHLDIGTVETPGKVAADDEEDIDTRIFWRQELVESHIWNSVAGDGAALSVTINPSGLTTFPKPIPSARNITHRGECAVADVDAVLGVLIYYEFVEFSLAEMGLFLARR